MLAHPTNAFAQGFGTDPSQISGPSASQISETTSAAFGSVGRAFEAFLYLCGIASFITFVLLAYRHHNRTQQGGGRSMDKDGMGYVFRYLAFLLLSAICFSAPTVMGSARETLIGGGQVTGVQAPPVQPSFN